jgi:hypothetical protein
MSLGWYLARLNAMPPSEIAWRVRSSTSLPVDWIHSLGRSVPKSQWEPLRPGIYPISLHAHGDAIGDIHVFDLKFPVGHEFEWHRDYRSGNRSTQDRCFAGTLSSRDASDSIDMKYLWEPSRHQHLSVLAYASNADQHSAYIAHSIDSWLQQNPYLRGLHWTSSLELSERILSWSLLYPRVAAHVETNANFRERWLDSIYLHLNRLARKPSLHSSANNHRIGELVGLFVGSICFSFWRDCAKWRDQAHRSLDQEVELQIAEDGVNREQAIGYHLFTLELLLLAFIVARRSGRPFSSRYAQRLRSMAHFLNCVATSQGDLPWYGDSDDGRAFLFAETESSLEVSTQLCGLLFGQPAWLRFRSSPTLATRALLPQLVSKLNPAAKGNAIQAPDHVPNEPSTSKSQHSLFHSSGLACLTAANGDIHLVMDFGPLGFNSTAAHGHADALSIWLSIGGEYFLVDAGTFAYHSHPQWRGFFRGTSAHNTARIDGLDQSEATGRFLWGVKAAARLLKFECNDTCGIIAAEHDGYQRLKDPVTHKRTVRFDFLNGSIRLEDAFDCVGEHEVEIFFHLHEDAVLVESENGRATIHWRGRAIEFSAANPGLGWNIVSACENPILGWRSRRFNHKQPIISLRLASRITGSTRICTCLSFRP